MASRKHMTALSIMQGGEAPPSILKTAKSLRKLQAEERKVQIDLQKNEEVTVENWKTVNRNNTFQQGVSSSCCCLI